MALQLYVQPRAGELIAQGIDGLTQGIEKYYQRKEENAKMEQAADFFARAAESNPELARSLNIRDPKDKAALKAGIKAVGGPMQFMQTANAMQQMMERQQEMDAFGNDQMAISAAASQAATPEEFAPLALRMGARPKAVEDAAQALFRTQQGTQDTATMRNAAMIVQDEVASGKLPNDPVAIARRRAELMAGGGEDRRFFGGSQVFIARDGSGESVVAMEDRVNGQVVYRDKDGSIKPIDTEKFEPVTRSDANLFMDEGRFSKYYDDFLEKESGVRALNKFMKTVGDVPTGVDRIFTDLSLKGKTLINAPLTAEEKAMGLAKAYQQRLLGAIRTSVLGPGVLTEIDAQRLIDAMGGDITSIFTNPEIFKQALSDIMESKYIDYDRSLGVVNAHIDRRYKTTGYSPHKRIERFAFGETKPKGSQVDDLLEKYK